MSQLLIKVITEIKKCRLAEIMSCLKESRGIYLATSSSWYRRSSKLWELMRRPQQGRQKSSRMRELLWRITPTRFMFLLPNVFKARVRNSVKIFCFWSNHKLETQIRWAHLRYESVTSDGQTVACGYDRHINGLKGKKQNPPQLWDVVNHFKFAWSWFNRYGSGETLFLIPVSMKT